MENVCEKAIFSLKNMHEYACLSICIILPFLPVKLIHPCVLERPALTSVHTPIADGHTRVQACQDSSDHTGQEFMKTCHVPALLQGV